LKVAIGIPAFNEEKNITKIITLLQRKFDTIIVCNDGSKDLTGEIAEKMGVVVINHKKNLGYGGSIRSLFLKAKEMGLEALITFDGDGQHRIEDIDVVLEKIKNNDADIVIGSRFLNEKNSQNVPRYREIGIKTITKISNLSSKSNLTDSQSGFRDENLNEKSPINPLTTYAKANRQAEIAAKKLADKKFTTTMLRFATVFGLSPRMRFDLAVNGMALGF